MNSDKKIGFLQDKIQSMLFDICKTQPTYAPLVPADVKYQPKTPQQQTPQAAPVSQLLSNAPLFRKQQPPKRTKRIVGNPQTMQFPPE